MSAPPQISTPTSANTPTVRGNTQGWIISPEEKARYDEIFNGVDFDMEVNFHDKGVMDFFEAIYARAIRRDAGATNSVVNIKATLQFPKGEFVRVLLTDCFFSDMPINFGGRSDYGTFKLAGSCADWKTI